MPSLLFCVKPQILKISNYFSFHLIPRYFWLLWLRKPGGSGTWLPPKGPALEAKGIKNPNTFLFTALWILCQSLGFGGYWLRTFGAWQRCVFSCVLSLYPVECSTAVCACVCLVSNGFPLQGCRCVCLPYVCQNWWRSHSGALTGRRGLPKIKTKTVLGMCQCSFYLGF